MAVVKGQAVRRREGVAPNTLVMAETGALDGDAGPELFDCPVRRCSTQAIRYADIVTHVAVRHPRHAAASAARELLAY